MKSATEYMSSGKEKSFSKRAWCFDITDNSALIPEDSQVTEFESKGHSYYFYITKTETKNHFVNALGTVLE